MCAQSAERSAHARPQEANILLKWSEAEKGNRHTTTCFICVTIVRFVIRSVSQSEYDQLNKISFTSTLWSNSFKELEKKGENKTRD